jgi:hypothetical protein
LQKKNRFDENLQLSSFTGLFNKVQQAKSLIWVLSSNSYSLDYNGWYDAWQKMIPLLKHAFIKLYTA